MTIKITIVGLGQIGASIGLALSGKSEALRRVGNDRDPAIIRQAEKIGAIDRGEFNLPTAVSDADLIILALPTDQIRETLSLIAPDLREGAVVMDTSPIKEAVATWVKELLPEKRHYIGLTPVINPIYLHSTETGINAAHADLFRDGLIAITTPPGANSEAIKLAADLTHLLGSMPLFADLAEVDGLMAATHLLPQLMAAALLNATVDQPGWREGRKMAGRAYAEVSAPMVHLGDAGALHASVLQNRQNVMRVLDDVIDALQTIRNDISAEDETALAQRLGHAYQERAKWWKERQAGDWTGDGIPRVEMPTAGSVFGRLFGLGRKPKPKK